MKAHETTTEIRQLGIDDSQELQRLAEVDTSSPLVGPVLGAIVDGRLVAAHSITTGRSIADPFRPTAEIRALLWRTARQLRGDQPRRGVIARLMERRLDRAARAHSLRMSGLRAPAIPGSEHTHLLRRGF